MTKPAAKTVALALVAFATLSGCGHLGTKCGFLEYHLNGKAHGWCKREKIANEYCEAGPGNGVKFYEFKRLECK